MSNVQIVTDSTAELSNDIIEAFDIHVVPWRVRVGSETLIDGPELRTVEFHEQLAKSKTMPVGLPPNPQQFVDLFASCARGADQIVAVLSSGQLNRVVQVARQARRELIGRCDVDIVDSRFISRALGTLVIEAAQTAQAGANADEIVRHVNGLISRSYFAFYVENAETLVRNSLIPDRTEYTGTASGYKPLLLMEEGAITPLQLSRKRGKPVERLVDFIAEFQGLDELYLVSTGLHPALSTLRSELAEAMPNQPFDEHIYGPVVLSYFGPTALGIVALEA